MEIAQATAFKADKRFADEKFYQIADHEGFFRRLKGADKAAVIAYFGDDKRVAHFLEVTPMKVEQQKPHAPGPDAKGAA